MSVKIRLQRRGRRKKPFYHIVVADARAPRDGRFIEKLGTYNPMTSPATIEIDRDRTFDWLMKGAQPTDTARAILKFKGVMYRKHLQRGVVKGALSQEKADEQYLAWVTEKDSQISARHKATADEKAAWHDKISGTAKPIVVKVEETVEDEVAAEATEESSAVETADVTEATPKMEAVEEAPAVEAEVSEETQVDETVEEAAPEESAETKPVEAPTEDAESPAEEAAQETEEGTTQENAEEAAAEDDTTEEKD